MIDNKTLGPEKVVHQQQSSEPLNNFV